LTTKDAPTGGLDGEWERIRKTGLNSSEKKEQDQSYVDPKKAAMSAGLRHELPVTGKGKKPNSGKGDMGASEGPFRKVAKKILYASVKKRTGVRLILFRRGGVPVEKGGLFGGKMPYSGGAICLLGVRGGKKLSGISRLERRGNVANAKKKGGEYRYGGSGRGKTVLETFKSFERGTPPGKNPLQKAPENARKKNQDPNVISENTRISRQGRRGMKLPGPGKEGLSTRKKKKTMNKHKAAGLLDEKKTGRRGNLGDYEDGDSGEKQRGVSSRDFAGGVALPCCTNTEKDNAPEYRARIRAVSKEKQKREFPWKKYDLVGGGGGGRGTGVPWGEKIGMGGGLHDESMSVRSWAK